MTRGGDGVLCNFIPKIHDTGGVGADEKWQERPTGLTPISGCCTLSLTPTGTSSSSHENRAGWPSCRQHVTVNRQCFWQQVGEERGTVVQYDST